MRTTHYLQVPERLYYMSPEKENVLRLVSDNNNHYLLFLPDLSPPPSADVFSSPSTEDLSKTTLRSVSIADNRKYYHGKAITFAAPEYRETESEFFLTEEDSRDRFLHYHDGVLSTYSFEEYLVNDNILYERHISPSSGTGFSFDLTLTNVQNNERVEMHCYEGEDIFSYRGAWYEFWWGSTHSRAIDLLKKDLDVSRDSSIVICNDILIEITIDDPIILHCPPLPVRRKDTYID
jgi:hypothetical protein